jgi:transposase
VPVDPNNLPDDAKALRKIVVDLTAQLDRETGERAKLEALIRELLDAKRNRKSEKLSKEQLALFEAAWQARTGETPRDQPDDQDPTGGATAGGESKPEQKKRPARQPLARNLKRERIVHDLSSEQKHCTHCDQDLRPIGEDTSERYEYIPASMKVIEDVCLKYACECTIHTATKPPQPIEKSTAGSSLLAQVIVAKFLDHLPLHRQQEMFLRHGVEISRKTMGGWLGQCALLLGPLWDCAKQYLFESSTIGTDDTPVKVLDPRLDFARIGRMWPYVGDREHPIVVFDYTATRERAGPAKFLEGYTGNLQADAYSVYDAFFRPGRGMKEIGC